MYKQACVLQDEQATRVSYTYKMSMQCVFVLEQDSVVCVLQDDILQKLCANCWILPIPAK